MQFYLRPVSGPRCLFVVLNSSGRPVYEVVGAFFPFGRRFFLLDEERNVVGRVSGVRLNGACQYSIAAGGKRIRMAVNYTVPRHPVKIHGRRWRFRGSVLTRSFDLIDESQQVVMTHGRCWWVGGECYALEVSDPEKAAICLCIAAVIDATVLRGCSVPVPAGG